MKLVPANRPSALIAAALPPRPAAPVAAPVIATPAADVRVTKPAAAPTHQTGTLKARDGADVAYRTTEPSGAPQAIVVMQQGTYGKPAFFDGMGEAFAGKSIKSYAVGSRVETTEATIHAADLQLVVEQARREHPGVPITVMGVSLGAAITLNWSATYNLKDQLPVVAMSPVVVPRYLGLGDLATIAAGLVSTKAADRQVHSPMSAGRVLTTNPRSPEAHLADPGGMKVPARLFGDVLKMTLGAVGAGRKMQGPLYVAMAGNDQVATNWSSRLLAKVIGSQAETLRTFPGLSHDLSQEWHDPQLVDALSAFVLQPRGAKATR